MIRQAQKRDCINLAALSLQVWLQTYATGGLRLKISQYALSTFTELHFLEILHNKSCDIWVYIKEDHLVGFVAVNLASHFNNNDNANGFEVTTLYVSEHFQGQGIGRQLLDKVKEQYGLSFWLSTWIHNFKAINFYNNLNFSLIGQLNFNIDGELHENHVFSSVNRQ